LAYQRKYSSGEIQKWFFDKAMIAKTQEGARRIVMRDDANRGRSNTVVGKLFFFRYNPKHKDTLPKYDKFPLVFPIEPYNDGFLGLNLHYLNLTERDALLSLLIKEGGNPRLNEYAKLRLSYTIIKRASNVYGLARPCVKRYLFGHVRSRFIEVYPGEWDKAIELPVADWVFNI